jgi:hypothetical protein
MNTYSKYVPNVFLAKCSEKHEKGEVIKVTTKYGKENDSIVFNLILEKDGFYYYSIVRTDGFNQQEWAKKRAEKLQNAALNAEKKSDQYWKTSHSITDNIPMGQPILVGHHSEARHRRDLDKSWNAMGKSVELSKKAEEYESRVAYWAAKANTINLSMPESLEFYEFELEKAKEKHEGLKNGTIERSHSFSLTYAKKEVNEIENKLNLAKRLWS